MSEHKCHNSRKLHNIRYLNNILPRQRSILVLICSGIHIAKDFILQAVRQIAFNRKNVVHGLNMCLENRELLVFVPHKNGNTTISRVIL